MHHDVYRMHAPSQRYKPLTLWSGFKSPPISRAHHRSCQTNNPLLKLWSTCMNTNERVSMIVAIFTSSHILAMIRLRLGHAETNDSKVIWCEPMNKNFQRPLLYPSPRTILHKMTIIQRILFLALICCVYGQLNLQKREFKAVAVAGLPEGHIYDSGEFAAHYDSRISSSNVPRTGSMRHGSGSMSADRSHQKPPISGKITDFSHNTGIGGYRWRQAHHRIRFTKSTEGLHLSPVTIFKSSLKLMIYDLWPNLQHSIESAQ